MSDEYIAELFLNIINELGRNNLINQAAWKDDVEKLLTAIEHMKFVGSFDSDDGPKGDSSMTNPIPPAPDDAELNEILDQLQARDFYDAMQAIEKLGASDDLTRSVNAVATVAQPYGNHISSREEAKAALTALMARREETAKRYVHEGYRQLFIGLEEYAILPKFAEFAKQLKEHSEKELAALTGGGEEKA